MKKRCIAILSALLFLFPLSGCGQTSKPVEMPQWAYIYDLFINDGTVYALRDQADTYITTELTDAPVCYMLDSKNQKEYDALWHEPSKRLYFSDGYGIYHCDLTGKEKTLLWEHPEGTKKDFARIAAAGDDRLLVCVAYGTRNSAVYSKSTPYRYLTRDYFSVDIVTGEALPVLGGVASYEVPQIVCTHENTVFFLQITSRDNSYSPITQTSGSSAGSTSKRETVAVCSIDLLTGEKQELGTFYTYGSISSGDGAVLEDTLYFMYDYSGIYAVPLSGGSVGIRALISKHVDGMTTPAAIEEANGNLYILMWDGVNYPVGLLCEWEPETGVLYAAGENATLPSAIGAVIRGDTWYLFSGTEVITGTLSQLK